MLPGPSRLATLIKPAPRALPHSSSTFARSSPRTLTMALAALSAAAWSKSCRAAGTDSHRALAIPTVWAPCPGNRKAAFVMSSPPRNRKRLVLADRRHLRQLRDDQCVEPGAAVAGRDAQGVLDRLV